MRPPQNPGRPRFQKLTDLPWPVPVSPRFLRPELRTCRLCRFGVFERRDRDDNEGECDYFARIGQGSLFKGFRPLKRCNDSCDKFQQAPETSLG